MLLFIIINTNGVIYSYAVKAHVEGGGMVSGIESCCVILLAAVHCVVSGHWRVPVEWPS